MSQTTETTVRTERRPPGTDSTAIRRTARRFGALNVAAGLLALVGPVSGNDDDGLVNTEPGLFLGAVAVNGTHAVVHVLHGLVGLAASRDAESARGYMGLSAAFFGALSAMGFRAFGFERGVHMMMGMAVDGWGNLGHAVLAAFSLTRWSESRSES